MAYKNKEDYNRYMKKYMRERYQSANKNDAIEKIDEPDMLAEDMKHEFNLSDPVIRKVFEMGKEQARKHEARDVEMILEKIEKYEKFVPVVAKFFQGFISSIKPQQPQQAQIRPPDGWLELSPMARLNYKYTRPNWYAAGLQYDNMMENGLIQPPNIEQPQIVEHEPQNLQQLQGKYPEPPLLEHNAPPQQEPPQQEPPKQENNKMDTMINALREDNARYINIAVEHLNNMKNAELKKHLQKPDEIYSKVKTYKMFLPIQLREMLLQTQYHELMEILKEKCPKKHAYIAAQNLEKQVKTVYSEIITLIKA
jgi:hypothetical protein